ncbi:hypothetical protein [Bradyrhizobium sp. S3.7.6]
MSGGASKPTMNGYQFRETVEKLGFTTLRGVSHFFGVNERTISRWIDANQIPRPVAMVLALMVEKELTPEDVLKAAKVDAKQIAFILKYLKDHRGEWHSR